MLYTYRQFHCIYKTDDIYKDIAYVETRFDTSNYELKCNSIGKPLRKGKNNKICWINDR